jgi:hypothetical protein
MLGLKTGRMFESRRLVGRLQLAPAVCIALLVMVPAARAAWQGPVPLQGLDASSQQLVGFGDGAVALSWNDSAGGVLLAHRAQTESGLRQTLHLGDLGTDGLGVGTLNLRDDRALVVASLDETDRTMVLAPDGSRGPLQEWPDGCAVSAVADSAYGSVAVGSCFDGFSVTHRLARRPAGTMAFGALSQVAMPIAGPIPPSIAVDSAGGLVAAWSDDCDFDAGTCDVFAAVAPAGAGFTSATRLGTTTQTNAATGIPSPIVTIDENGDGLVVWPEETGGAHRVMGAAVSGSATIGAATELASDTAPIAALFTADAHHGAAAVVWFTGVSTFEARLAGATRASASDPMTTTVLAPRLAHSNPFDPSTLAAGETSDQRTLAMLVRDVGDGGARGILWRAGAAAFAVTPMAAGSDHSRLDVADSGAAAATWDDATNGANVAIADPGDAAFPAGSPVAGYPGWSGTEVADLAVDDAGDVLLELNDRATPSPAHTQASIRPAGGTFGALEGMGPGLFAHGAGALIFGPSRAFALRSDVCIGGFGYFVLDAVALPADANCSAVAPAPLDISGSAQPLGGGTVTPPASSPGTTTTPSPIQRPVTTIGSPVAAPAPRVRAAVSRAGKLTLTIRCATGCTGDLTVRITGKRLKLRGKVKLDSRDASSHKYGVRLKASSRAALRRARRAHRRIIVQVSGRLVAAAGATWTGTQKTRVRS